MKLNNFASVVLVTSAAISGANTVHATEEVVQPVHIQQQGELKELDSNSTYWGIGIGSVLGAVIAGPPGAALGATLGGSFGWGHEKEQELTQSLAALQHKDQALNESEMALRRNQSQLNHTRQQVSELERSNILESARLANLMAQGDGSHDADKQAVLQGLIAHYAQEVYFRKGESDVPDYAKSRLDKLTEFLKSNPDLKVTLTGYTDHQGPVEFNADLAQTRAEGIRDVLLEQGVDAQRVTVVSVGEAESLVQQGDDGNYVLDRRVSIELDVLAPELFPLASLQEVAK